MSRWVAPDRDRPQRPRQTALRCRRPRRRVRRSGGPPWIDGLVGPSIRPGPTPRAGRCRDRRTSQDRTDHRPARIDSPAATPRRHDRMAHPEWEQMMGIAQKVSRNFSDAVRSRGQSYFVKGRVTVMAARRRRGRGAGARDGEVPGAGAAARLEAAGLVHLPVFQPARASRASTSGRRCSWPTRGACSRRRRCSR